jgi:putative solute:sodium symporter small subunit|tara:strand:- start:591 stop:866 length:276 start_codon:yes stop_codon:yes gene_type:complete
MQEKQDNQIDTYWQANIRLVLSLLSIWFLVSFGCGILFVDFLDQFKFFGFNLGFWFAQQGSIYVFVILIFVYIHRIKKLEQIFDKDESTEE